MKKVFKKYLILTLIATVFISGNGVMLAIHTCLHSSEKSVSLFKTSNDCCENEECAFEKGEIIDHLSSNCCKSEYSYHKISTPFVGPKAKTSTPFLLWIAECFSNKFYRNFNIVSFQFKSLSFKKFVPFFFDQLLI